MAYYLCKTEPEILRFNDLLDQRELEWVGVTNPAALEHLRGMRAGDEWIVFEAGRGGAAVGTARVVNQRLDGHGAPVVRVAVGMRFAHPRSQDEVLDEPLFDDSPLVTMGRLPVVPLSREQWDWFHAEPSWRDAESGA